MEIPEKPRSKRQCIMDRVSGVFLYEINGPIANDPERLTVKFNEVLAKALLQFNQGREAGSEVGALDGVWMAGRQAMGTSLSGPSENDITNCAYKVARMLPFPLGAGVSVEAGSAIRHIHGPAAQESPSGNNNTGADLILT